ncbi:MAG: TraX family protein [Oscillospiraceae bacterium]|nr:TraX family protein [Oscillospiraceae bacterium]
MDKGLEKIDRFLQYRLPGVFSSAVLKYVAAFFMLVDHAAVVMIMISHMMGLSASEQNKVIDTYRIMRHLGRFSFPVFCFFISEGYCYTKNKIRYLCNLIVFGIISEIPFKKALFTDESILNGKHSNVFFTLALGLLSVWCIDSFLTSRYTEASESIKRIPIWIRTIISAAVVSALCYIAYFFHTDYRHGGVIIIVLFFLFRHYPVFACCVAYAAICWYNRSELWSAPAFLMLMMYNGNRGRQSKYFFYIFYPLHLTFLCIIKEMLIKG